MWSLILGLYSRHNFQEFRISLISWQQFLYRGFLRRVWRYFQWTCKALPMVLRFQLNNFLQVCLLYNQHNEMLREVKVGLIPVYRTVKGHSKRQRSNEDETQFRIKYFLQVWYPNWATNWLLCTFCKWNLFGSTAE